MNEFKVLNARMLDGTPVISGLPNCSDHVPSIVIQCETESGFLATVVIPFTSPESAESAREQVFNPDIIKMQQEIREECEE